MAKPLPGLDVPVINSTGQMNQAWFEYFQSLLALVNVLANPVIPTVSADRLVGNPTGSPAAASEISLGFGLAFSGTSLIANISSSFSSALTSDVALNNISNYFTGPSVAQGTSGIWLVSGTVTVIDTATAPAAIYCKLWDGTTLINSAAGYSTNITRGLAISLCGIITAPAGNLRISCRGPDATTGKILFNETGNSKDSNITAVRLA